MTKRDVAFIWNCAVSNFATNLKVEIIRKTEKGDKPLTCAEIEKAINKLEKKTIVKKESETK